MSYMDERYVKPKFAHVGDILISSGDGGLGRIAEKEIKKGSAPIFTVVWACWPGGCTYGKLARKTRIYPMPEFVEDLMELL